MVKIIKDLDCGSIFLNYMRHFWIIVTASIISAFNGLCDLLEYLTRCCVIWFANCLHVKIIRDDKGVPFLYRYHILSFTNDGPGICIHRFVKSDPDRGFHDHPWQGAFSYILCGGYKERILNLDGKKNSEIQDHTFDMNNYEVYHRKRWRFNCLKGKNSFHRVMIDPGTDAWTIFFFTKRSKTWGMIDLQGQYNRMSIQVKDNDGGWWNHVGTGYEVNNHKEHEGKVIATVDIVVRCRSKILLIQRGKDPYKDFWALPGGRIEQKDSNMLSAAKRELKEETNIDCDMKYVTTIGNNKRDPRGFTVSMIYLAELDEIPENVKAGDDAVNYEWYSLNDLPDLAFDHKKIINDILKKSVLTSNKLDTEPTSSEETKLNTPIAQIVDVSLDD